MNHNNFQECINFLTEYLFGQIYFLYGYNDDDQTISNFLDQEITEYFLENNLIKTQISKEQSPEFENKITAYFNSTFTSLNYDDEDRRVKAYYFLLDYFNLSKLNTLIDKIKS